MSTAATARAHRDQLTFSQQSIKGNTSDFNPNLQSENNENCCKSRIFEGRGYFKGQCYRCGGSHMAEHFKEVKGIICYRCRQPGNIYQVNVNRETTAGGLLQQLPPFTLKGIENRNAHHNSKD